jgi:hypothetical protein
MQLPDLEPGTWADWANAIATALAFTVALVLFVIGLRDRRNAADDHLRDQARRVWISSDTQADLTIRDLPALDVVWVIVNTSDEAIINCRVGTLDMPRAYIAKSEPDVALLLPESEARGKQRADPLIEKGDTPPPVQVIFTDAAGVQWWRDSHGKLELWKRPSRKAES